MKPITLLPADPERHFKQLAAWFTLLEGEPHTEPGLKEYYHRTHQRITQEVAQDEQGQLLGFYWALRHNVDPQRYYLYLYVDPTHRRQGFGDLLYQHLLRAMRGLGAVRLRVNLWDDCPECRSFAEQRGFTTRERHIAMELDLETFDDSPYDQIIARLQADGFRFTTMEELGNTEEAQRKLYHLNDTAAMDTPGSDGGHPWASFEDFQRSVCQADWYKPAGQMVVIDEASGDWAAMSAITRFEGNDAAHNLFTGVYKRYRGRKLGQAVKVLALRFARDVLQVRKVRTNHNALNEPMLAIDRKLGYAKVSGSYLMERRL
jgi:GNAT superfamily N-acetyltransferase